MKLAFETLVLVIQSLTLLWRKGNFYIDPIDLLKARDTAAISWDCGVEGNNSMTAC